MSNIDKGNFMREVYRNSDIPIYKQIAAIINEEIKQGLIKPGEKLMPELELAKTFSVSRMTVRMAIDEMIKQRTLTRKRGYGTCILEKPTQRVLRPNVVNGFYEDFSSQGKKLLSFVLEREVMIAPPEVAEVMHLPSGSRVCKITRVRSVDRVPIVYDESYLVHSLWKYIKDVDFSDCSLFKVIEKKAGIIPKEAELTFRACTANSLLAKHLGLTAGDPLLFVRMMNYSGDGIPMQLGNLYCPDTMDMSLRISNSNEQNRGR